MSKGPSGAAGPLKRPPPQANRAAGQTASSSYKPALLDNGVRVMVPPHIGAGTRIVVDVYERSYVGKVG